MARFSLSSLAVALGLAVAVLSAAPPAGAAGLRQAGGVDNWYVLEAGQSAEWLFQYPGNEPALLAFGIDPAGAIRVDVYTDEQWRAIGGGTWPVEPVGRGTTGTLLGWPNEQALLDSGDLFWEAMAPKAVLYHIQLTNATQAAARYWITQAGPGAGQLAPYAPPVAANPAPAAATATPRPAVAPPSQPAAGGQAPVTLPETGGPATQRAASMAGRLRLE